MYNKINYKGKQSDCIAATLLMALEAIGIENIPHPDCLSTRPFAVKSPLQHSALWLAPFIEPLAGVLIALDVLGVRSRFRIFTTSLVASQWTDILATMIQWLKDGPVIIGPLNRRKIWDRIDSSYYRGSAHFILAIAYRDNKYIIVHDPEGCPYYSLARDKLLSALDPLDFEVGILQLQAISRLHSYEEICRLNLLRGIESSVRASYLLDGGSKGLSLLAGEVASRQLRSSEEGALHFALPALGLSEQYVANFFLDLPQSLTNEIPNGNKIIQQLSKIYFDDVIHCAYALESLTVRDKNKLSEQLLSLAKNRALIERLLASLEIKSSE